MKLLTPLLGASALTAAMLAVSPAVARTDINPYIEVQQVFTADLSDSGGTSEDVVTYTAAAAGVDALISTRRIEVGASYRYERRIDWSDDISNDDIHSGVVRGRMQVTRGLSLEAGAAAARTRVGAGGGDAGFGVGDADNTSQVYAAYAGPTFSTRAGPLDIGAAYQIGYTHVEDDASANDVPGQPPVDYVDSTTVHQAQASVGMEPGGALPVGWVASAGWAREDSEQLDQRYESILARLDVTVPVTATLAFIGGVGYENIEITQDDILVDADGDPVLDQNGRLQGDPNAPRLLAYETDGFIFDAGILWRPSPRLELTARAGWRYESTFYAGTLSYQLNDNAGLSLVVYNTIDSFGRSTIDTISGLPTDFRMGRNGFGQFDNCAFGNGENPGGCFGNDFQSAANANFRSRGASLVYSGGRGPWSYGVGAGYQHRRFLAPSDTAANFELDGVTEQNFALQANLRRELNQRSSIGGDLYANWYDTSLPGGGDVFSWGGSASYYINFTRALAGQATAGVFANEFEDGESDVSGAMLLGLRYGF